jgi:hypothetical protein
MPRTTTSSTPRGWRCCCVGRRAVAQGRPQSPRPADVRVVRDGSPLHETAAAALNLDVHASGVYRIEARIDGRLWLLSNPIHLR